MRHTIGLLGLLATKTAGAAAALNASSDTDDVEHRQLLRGTNAQASDELTVLSELVSEEEEAHLLEKIEEIELAAADSPQRGLMDVMYAPLSCNTEASIDSDACLDTASDLSALVNAASVTGGPVVVPCGQCAIVDYVDGSTITIPSGLDIVGRLHFPPTANVMLNTTAVFVQGQLDIEKPNAGNKVTVTLYGTEDQYFYPHDLCSGEYNEACTDKKNMGTKPVVVAGGKLNINAYDESCPAWTTLVSKVSDTQLEVDPAFASCVRVGDSILVTSSEWKWDADNTPKVSAVDSGTGVITLETEITRSLPGTDGPGEPEFAVEVASLSRDVLFTAQEDNPAEEIGGHLIVFHTMGVEQIISGIKINNFGQGGILGRYPIHFHMSDNSPSFVTKNVIVNSNQRCVVIHNTNGVTIDNNVAHDTHGHCYVTESGIEVNNIFKHNLGAKTRKLNFSNGQSDSNDFWDGKHQAATFWVRNMMNEFYGNVAAGSQSLGWWFEMKDKKNNMLSTGPTPSFRDNVAHSCNINGMTKYKPGWNPSNGGVFENIRIYKNGGEAGAKFHITGYLTIRDSLFADNRHSIRYGVWNTGVTLQDSKIIALSKDLMLREGQTCPSTSHGIYHSYNNYPTATIQHAMKLENVTFEHFTCGSKIIATYFDGRQNDRGMGNPIQASVTITENDEEKIKPSFPCDGNAKYAFMEDFGGGLGPDAMGFEPGFIIRNAAHMKAFLPPNACEPLPYGGKWTDGTRCNAFCKNVCLRYFSISSDIAATKLVLSEGDTSYSFYPESGYSDFRMVLPAGNYYGKFYDENEVEVVAQSVTVNAYRVPQCTDYADESSFVFDTREPTTSPSASPTISAAPSVVPDPFVRVRSDKHGRYLFVDSDATWVNVKPGLRKDVAPSADKPREETDITLKRTTCPDSAWYYRNNNIIAQCYNMIWYGAKSRKFWANQDRSWTGGLNAATGAIYTKYYWYVVDTPCLDGGQCVRIINAQSGRGLYDTGTALGASPKNKPDYVDTNGNYVWKLIDILDDNVSCSLADDNCVSNSDCCSFYCQEDGTCAHA